LDAGNATPDRYFKIGAVAVTFSINGLIELQAIGGIVVAVEELALRTSN